MRGSGGRAGARRPQAPGMRAAKETAFQQMFSPSPAGQIRLRAGSFRSGRVPTSPRSGRRSWDRIWRSHPRPAQPQRHHEFSFQALPLLFPLIVKRTAGTALEKSPKQGFISINKSGSSRQICFFFKNELYFGTHGSFFPNRLQNPKYLGVGWGEINASQERERKQKVTRHSHRVPLPLRTPGRGSRRTRVDADAKVGAWRRPEQAGGRCRAPGGLSVPTRGAVPGAPLPSPRLCRARARPGRPDSRRPRSSRTGLAPTPAPRVPGRPAPHAAPPPPPPRVQKAPEKPPRAGCAPSACPAGLPSRPGAPSSR